MKKIVLFMLLAIISASSFAAADTKQKQKQCKADITNARLAIKNSKDLEKNEANLRKYLQDSQFDNNLDVRAALFDVIKKEYDVNNEKAYLKQKLDTAAFMKTICRLFIVAEHLDSIDAKPNSKGVVAPEYRKKHAAILTPYRKNLLSGGQYFFAHKDWQETWNTLTLYLDCTKQPLFDGQTLDTAHDITVAYMLCVSAAQMNDIDKAKLYANDAEKYEHSREATIQMMAELCYAHKDTASYSIYLRKGFRDYPKSKYFFPHLIDYYADREEYANALKYANRAVMKDSTNTLFLMAQHSMMMALNDYDNALVTGIKLLAKNENIPMANYNVGYIYYLRAQKALTVGNKPYRQRIKDAQKQYRLCQPYMERYRQLAPDDISRWRPVLYDVYLNLNLGKEFTEIEHLSVNS